MCVLGDSKRGRERGREGRRKAGRKEGRERRGQSCGDVGFPSVFSDYH